MNRTLKYLIVVLVVAVAVSNATAAELVIPGHGSSFDWARGYWFTAPVCFDVTGLRVPTGASDSIEQSIQIVRLNSTWDAYPDTTTDFTPLGYWGRNNSYDWIDTNIRVNAGDMIGIIGERGGITDYGAYTGSGWDTTILGNAVTLERFGYQGDIDDAPAPNVWREPLLNDNIGRIEMRYQDCETPVTPELSTWALLACSGVVGLVLRRRRKA